MTYRSCTLLLALAPWLGAPLVFAQLVIPSVVHVIHQNGPENISDAQVHSQIDVLNADFRRLNADTVNTRAIFLAVAADMDIEFCLATIAPDGSPTTGIDRIHTSETSPSALIAAHGWDRDHYMNIYVMPGGNCFSSFPWDPVDQDGIFITHGRFGTTGTAGTEEHAEFARFGRTATHEVGHFLGLLHTFSFIGDINLCFGGDSVCDTPPTDMRWMVSTCLSHELNTNLEEPDLPDQVENFMDYNVDSCSNMFSLGQRDRVHQCISRFRSDLSSATNLTVTGCASGTGLREEQAYSVVLFPNPASSTVELRMGSAPPSHITVHDLTGSAIQAFRVSPGGFVDVNNLACGAYLVRPVHGHSFPTQRLIIAR